MSVQYSDILKTLEANGPALASSTFATSLLNPQAIYRHSGLRWQKQGHHLWVRAAGLLSCTATPSLTFTLLYGGNVFQSTGAVTLTSATITNLAWVLDAHLEMRTTGSAANWEGIFELKGIPFTTAGSAQPGGIQIIEGTSTNQDFTAPGTVDFQAQWSTNSASNSITCKQYMLQDTGLLAAA